MYKKHFFKAIAYIVAFGVCHFASAATLHPYFSSDFYNIKILIEQGLLIPLANKSIMAHSPLVYKRMDMLPEEQSEEDDSNEMASIKEEIEKEERKRREHRRMMEESMQYCMIAYGDQMQKLFLYLNVPPNINVSIFVVTD